MLWITCATHAKNVSPEPGIPCFTFHLCVIFFSLMSPQFSSEHSAPEPHMLLCDTIETLHKDGQYFKYKYLKYVFQMLWAFCILYLIAYHEMYLTILLKCQQYSLSNTMVIKNNCRSSSFFYRYVVWKENGKWRTHWSLYRSSSNVWLCSSRHDLV